MRKPGFARSQPKPSPDALSGAVAAGLVAMAGFASIAAEASLQQYAIIGDAIPASLTGAAGDAVDGRAIVLDRRLGACLLCHTGPFPEERFQGTLAPDLAGAGSRWSVGQLRLRLVDPTRLNPETIMPPYYRVDGLTRVGSAWRGQPMLTAEQVEDVVAFLSTLRD
jgi:L-cysteine S-thiosulfotransferase